MSTLRFKSKLNPWKENGILVYTTSEDSEILPLTENELVLVPLQFSIIEPGPFVYAEEINEATWIAELLPYSESIEEAGTVFITKITKARDSSTIK